MLEEIIPQQIFTINNLKVVHGVSWFPIISDLENKEDEEKDILNLTTQHNAGMMVRLDGIKNNSFPLVGLVNKKASKNFPNPKKESIYAIGALFSQLCKVKIFNENSIFLLNIDDFEELNTEEHKGKILSVVIENNLPLSGSELFLEKQELYSYLKNNWLSKNIEFSIYTHNLDKKELEKFVPDNFEIIKLDLNYLQHINAEQLFKCQLFIVKGDTTQQKRAAIAIVAILGFLGYSYWEDVYRYFVPPPPPPMTSVDYVKKYKEGVNNLLSKNIVFGAKKLNYIRNVINQIPMNVSGWKLNKLECKQDNCYISYVPIKNMPTNYYIFQKEIENLNLTKFFSNIQYKFDGKNVNLKFLLNKGKDKDTKNNKNANLYDNIIPVKNFEIEIISVYQDLKQLNNFNFAFQKLENVRVTGINLKELKTQLIKKGKFMLSTNGWLLQELPIGDNMVIENFKLNMQKDNSTNLIIQGTYYVKE